MSAEQLQNLISPKLTTEVLKNIVTKSKNLNDVRIKSIEIDNGTGKKGDSYISQTCRFTIHATGKNEKNQEKSVTIPVFVKFLPKNIARRKTFRCPVFFENEINFYTKVLPSFQKFQESKPVSQKSDNVPLLLSAHIDGTNDYLVLADLTFEGYEGIPRGIDLDEYYTSAFLKLLANFHALSLAFKTQDPENFEKAASVINETYYHEKYRSWFEPHLKNLFVAALDAVEKELPGPYLHQFQKFLKNDVYGDICRGCNVRGRFSVINHGDLWAPNFLIKHQNSKNIEKIVMIDFQLSRYTTLSADLSFFLFTCIDIRLLEEQWNALISLYYEALSNSLKELDCRENLITLEQLHKELENNMIFGVGVAIENIIMSLLDEDEVVDLDTLQGEEAVPVTNVWKVRPFKDKARRQRFARFVKFVADKNFI